MESNNSKSKYIEILKSIESGTTIREHCKHREFENILLEIFEGSEKFTSVIQRKLLYNLKTWIFLIPASIIGGLVALYFPNVWDYLCSKL